MKSTNLYFSNRKEYYRRKHISEALIKYYREHPKVREKVKQIIKPTIYFVNFDIAEAIFKGKAYVRGSLSSSKKFGFNEAKALIRKHLPVGYTPINFYEAEEAGEQKEVLLVLLREDDEIFQQVLNV